ncbi:MAG: MFS transporter [Clostridia bacterium]|nr:MFS transporter [Clostridia bacterium]
MEESLIKRNIKIYYLYMSMFQLIVGPILTLYLVGKGLNFTQIMFLQSFFSVAIFILEVPTGAFGDLIGRRVSLFLAGIAMALGAIAYITGNSIVQFALGELLFACGMSLKSGSDTALVYDSLKKLDRTAEFTAIQGKGESYCLGAQIIGSVVSGVIYEIHPELPLIVSALLMILSAISALFYYEIKTYEHEEAPKYWTQIKESAVFLVRHKRVRAVVFYFIFFYVFYRVGFWYYQPYMQQTHIDAKYFGLIFALFNIVATLSARFSHRYVSWTKGKSMILLSVLMAASFLLMGITTKPFGFLFICLQQVTRGVNGPVMMKYMNKHIPSNKRATIISFSSLLKNLAAAVAFPIVGFAMDRIDAVSINLYSGLLMVAGIIYFYFYLKTKMKATPAEAEAS